MVLIFILIGLVIAVVATVQFAKDLGNPKKSILSAIWEWIKNVFDAITSIG